MRAALAVAAVLAVACSTAPTPPPISVAADPAVPSEPPPATNAPTAAEAKAFIERTEQALLQRWMAAERAAWVKATYITGDTAKLAAKAYEAVMAYTAAASAEAVRYDKVKLPDEVPDGLGVFTYFVNALQVGERVGPQARQQARGHERLRPVLATGDVARVDAQGDAGRGLHDHAVGGVEGDPADPFAAVFQREHGSAVCGRHVGVWRGDGGEQVGRGEALGGAGEVRADGVGRGVTRRASTGGE